MGAESYNLIRKQWLPVRRADDRCEYVAPWQITDDLAKNPIVAADWPRADFNGATLEFLIGLLATTFAPKDFDDWLDHWNEPPPPDTLRDAFERAAFAFNLDGDGPLFMQELDPLDRPSERGIASLLIEQPGLKSVKFNTDLFVHHGGVARLSRASAAMALFTAQAYSPAGGAGFLTSMRGGGPLTTLVAADRRGGKAGLWHMLWANVPNKDWPDWRGKPERVFPWLAPTRTVRDHPVTTPEHGHALQAFWGMPRRVHLVFEPAAGRACDLGSPPDDVLVVGWQTKQHGVKYQGWVHPLTPYVQRETDEPPSPVHAKPGGITYQHWLGLVQDDPAAGRVPARCVHVFRDDRARDTDDLAGIRLITFGYDMDNMKARCWYQSAMPVPNVPIERRPLFDGVAAQMVNAAGAAVGMARSAVRRALFARPTEASGDFSDLSDQFWRDTEASFFTFLGQLAGGAGDDETLRERWLGELRRGALGVFDDAVPLEAIEAGAWQRIVNSRQTLVRNLNGRRIRAALGLGVPQGGRGQGGNMGAAA